MTKVEKLERETQNLSAAELAAFREYDSNEWDRRIEEDVQTGKLDALAKEALAAHGVGATRRL